MHRYIEVRASNNNGHRVIVYRTEESKERKAHSFMHNADLRSLGLNRRSIASVITSVQRPLGHVMERAHA